MNKSLLKLMLMLSVGVMAQQQTFEFFKWGAVSNPLPNWRDRGQNVNDPYKTDSQGRTWSVSSDQSVISWYNNKDTNKINVPVSPNRKKAYANYNSIRPQVDENNTKIVSLYASRYVVNKYYYDWYFAKTNEAGQTQYVHPTDLGVTDSSSYISNYACIGGKLLINLSNNKYIWQGDLAANLPSMSGMLFSDRKNTIFLIYPGSSYGIYSLHADGSYHKRLGTATVKNYSFDVTTGDLTIVTYENQIYKLNGNTEQLVTIPSSTQLLKTNVQVWPLSLRKATQQAQVVLTEKGFNVQEDGRNNTFLFSQLSTLGLDSLELGSYDHLDCAKLQKDSSIALVYRKSNGSYVQQYYVFAYKKGVVALKAKLDVTSLNLSTKSEFVNILSAGHSYFYLKNSSNINNIIQYKDEKATLIPYRSPNCSLYIMDWAIDEDYLWLSNEASETSPCAVARMRHDDYFVEGRVYYDMNANGIREITELPYNMLKLAVEPSGLLVFPDQQGNFAFKGLAGSAYSVKVLDSVRFVSVKADNKGNIGVKLLEEIPEVKAFFLLPRARCFTNRPANVTLQNVGVVPAEKVVVRLSADNMKLLQDSILVDTAIFTYYSIAAGQTLHTTYNIQWPEASQVGQTATLRTVTEMYLGGVLAAVKHDSVQTVIRCSYDPNDKTVTPVGVGNESFTLKEDVLKYLIRFENTGNDTAYHIVIKDTLSNHLDMSTLTVVSASHNVKTELSAAGVLAFHFDYIMLPDTGTNKEAAQGYVSFMIKPKADVANNTLLCNTAAIYFDQNPPIITNNACNMLVDELPNIISGLEGNTLEKVSYIYPNPAKEWIKVSEDVAMVRLFNQHGEELLHTANHNIDVAALPNGLYLMQIALNNGSVRTEKFVMMK